MGMSSNLEAYAVWSKPIDTREALPDTVGLLETSVSMHTTTYGNNMTDYVLLHLKHQKLHRKCCSGQIWMEE